jgi:hypothetical protein
MSASSLLACGVSAYLQSLHDCTMARAVVRCAVMVTLLLHFIAMV